RRYDAVVGAVPPGIGTLVIGSLSNSGCSNTPGPARNLVPCQSLSQKTDGSADWFRPNSGPETSETSGDPTSCVGGLCVEVTAFGPALVGGPAAVEGRGV